MNKKRIVIGFIITVTMIFMSVTAVTANPQTVNYNINVVLNGQQIHFADDMRPFTMNGRTFLPLRAISETLDIAVDFDAATNTAFLGERPATSPPQTVNYGINVVLNGQQIHFASDMRPLTMNSRTFLPLRTISETLGIAVDFDAATNTVFLGERPAIAVVPPPPPPQGGAVRVGDIIPFGGHNWRVLDVQDGRALIITENTIGQRMYHGSFESVTWEHSTLRHYLNNEFLNSFSEADRARIAETRIVNNDNPWFGTSGGNDTNDRIFLLSLEEVVRYFGDSGQLGNRNHPNNGWWGFSDQYNNARIAIDRNADERCWWWLRSPGIFSDYAAYVLPNGLVNVNGFIVNPEAGGVRPALWLDL